jgi:hypothetical protein
MNRLPRRAQPMGFQVREPRPSLLSRFGNIVAWIVLGPFVAITMLGRVVEYLLWLLTNAVNIAIGFIAIPFLFGVIVIFVGQVVIMGVTYALSGLLPAIVALVLLLVFTVSLIAVVASDTNKTHLRGSEFSEQKPPTFPTTNSSTTFPATPSKPLSGSQSMPTRPVRRRF